MDDWYNRIGEDNYACEYKKWNESKCITETIVDEHWQLIGQENLSLYSEFNNEHTYYPNDYCRSGNFVWQATDTVTGTLPYIRIGYQDSLPRYMTWIDTRIQLMDDYLHIYNIPTDILKESITEQQTEEYLLIDILGHPLSRPVQGINIYIYKDGRVKKVWRK